MGGRLPVSSQRDNEYCVSAAFECTPGAQTVREPCRLAPALLEYRNQRCEGLATMRQKALPGEQLTQRQLLPGRGKEPRVREGVGRKVPNFLLRGLPETPLKRLGHGNRPAPWFEIGRAHV